MKSDKVLKFRTGLYKGRY